MLTQRISISAVCGYSSLSIMFLSKDSVSSRTASGSIHVVTKVARFIRAFPSSISSSWIVSYATLAGTSCGPSRCRGIDSPPRSNNGSTDSSVVRGCRPAGCFRGTGALLRLATGCEGAPASRTVRGHPPPGLAPRQAAGLVPDRFQLRESTAAKLRQVDVGYARLAPPRGLAMQVATCLSSSRGRRVQGPRGPHQASDPRRAGGPGRADALRALHPPHDEARPYLQPAGGLPASGRAGGRRAGLAAPAGPLHVPSARHLTARRDRPAVAHPYVRTSCHGSLSPASWSTTRTRLRFYTDVLGYVKKTEIPTGDHRWL